MKDRFPIAIAFAYIAITTFRSSVTGPYYYDEDQFFVAPFAVGRFGLLPYRDFPYFHMPNLVYAYAPLFWLTNQPFLAARLMSGFSAMLIAITVFLVSRSLFSQEKARTGLIAGLSTAVLVTNSSFYALAASHIWNHAPSTLCALLAFTLHSRALRSQISIKHLLLSGVLVGMAVGIRLSFVILIVPFLLMLFLFSKGETERKIVGTVTFGIGGLLSNAPGLYSWIMQPAQFWFGNIDYAKLNTLYRAEMGFDTAMSIGGKFFYVIRLVFSQPSDVLIIFAVIFCLVGTGISQVRQSMLAHPEYLFLILLLPFLYVGSFAPSPSWPQYFFAPLPFLALVGPYALAYLKKSEARVACLRVLSLAAVLSCLCGGFPKTPSALVSLLDSKTWACTRVHAAATELSAEASTTGRKGTMVTLVSSFAAEAGIPVHPSFVVGIFGWRVSHLLTPVERRRQLMPDPAELQSLFEHDPPIVLFKESSVPRTLEEPIRRCIDGRRYRSKKLMCGLEVWLPSL